MKISYSFTKTPSVYHHLHQIKHSVSLFDNDDMIGDCNIEGLGIDNCFDNGLTCSLTISIDDDYQSKGYSRMLLKELVTKMKTNYPIRSDQMFFIDADASNGFWDHIGMKYNRYGYDYHGKRNLEGKGYEKVIILTELEKWIDKK
jgi:hypothetical protein